MFGDRSTQLASAYFNLAFVLTGMERYHEALDTYNQCYDMRVGLLGTVHELTLAALNNSAYVLERMGQHADALERYRRCLEIAIQLHGDRHVEVADAQQSIAVRLVSAR